MKKKAVCILSGGMDSATCAYIARQQDYEIIALHFDYQQRTMEKERACFELLCNDLEVINKAVLNVDFIAAIGGNSLTDKSLSIRENNLNKDELPNTYVPFRNGVFLSIAAALAQKENASDIFIGVVAEDSSGYPDCSADFISKINMAINSGTGENIKIHTPLVNLSKSEIVCKALELQVPLQFTWSCYQSNDKPCGLCDSCLLRKKGFEKVGIIDPIL
ncbi:MAG: 7-cyano-7-deazaguanine synthase QueC [Cardiobacteriaceae bacterium]|nr:7-cyano-7-deazaguanine synthase QueC [Cardiobacteriaceae bacterium]